jgi:ABC-2 type transport system permease protein
VFLLAALVVIYIFNFRVLPLDRLPLDQFAIRNGVSYMNLALAGFVISALSARFVYPMVSLEGKSFWVIKTAPLTLRSFLWTKFAIAVVPLLILGEFLIIITDHYLRVAPSVFWISVITMFFMTFGIVGLGVGLGAIYPRFNYENPAKIAVGFGGVMYMILSMAYIGVIVFLEGYPAYVIFVSKYYRNLISDTTIAWIVLCFSIVAVVIALATWLPMRIGLRRLERTELA